jgi:hypothetical protein
VDGGEPRDNLGGDCFMRMKVGMGWRSLPGKKRILSGQQGQLPPEPPPVSIPRAMGPWLGSDRENACRRLDDTDDSHTPLMERVVWSSILSYSRSAATGPTD